MLKKFTVNILYVDDEENNLVAFKANFRQYFNVFVASSAEEGKKILSATEIHILITDQRMPGTTGTQLLSEAVKNYPDQIRILLTAYPDRDKSTLVNALNKGLIYKFLVKPWNEEELKTIIEKAYQYHSSLRELKKKEIELTGLKAKIDEEHNHLIRQKLGL